MCVPCVYVYVRGKSEALELSDYKNNKNQYGMSGSADKSKVENSKKNWLEMILCFYMYVYVCVYVKFYSRLQVRSHITTITIGNWNNYWNCISFEIIENFCFWESRAYIAQLSVAE